MDKFQMAENAGRAKAQAALKKISFSKTRKYHIVPTEGFCKWDFEVREDETETLLAVVEAKDRRMRSDSYLIRSGGVQLEEMKYNALRQKAEKDYCQAYYLATFMDNKFMLFDVVNGEVTDDYRMCNKTTAEFVGKIQKHCYYFATDTSLVTSTF